MSEPALLALPVSPRELRRFTPETYEGVEHAPVYLIAVPNEFERARWARDCAAARARPVSRAELVDTLREAAGALYEGDDLTAALRTLDHQAELVDVVREAAERQEELPPHVVDDLAATTAAVRALELAARRDHSGYAQLYADFEFYLEVAPLLAAQHFLRGWEGVSVPFKRNRKDGTVPVEVLEQIPRADWWAIGLEAMAATKLTDAQRKN